MFAVGDSRNLGSCGDNGILCGAHGRSPEKSTRKSPWRSSSIVSSSKSVIRVTSKFEHQDVPNKKNGTTKLYISLRSKIFI